MMTDSDTRDNDQKGDTEVKVRDNWLSVSDAQHAVKREQMSSRPERRAEGNRLANILGWNLD